MPKLVNVPKYYKILPKLVKTLETKSDYFAIIAKKIVFPSSQTIFDETSKIT